MLELQTLPENHRSYNEYENQPDQAIGHLRRIINRLKDHPEVESIAIAMDNASFPGTGGINSGIEYCNAMDTTLVASVQFISFVPEEDYFNTFRHTKDYGKKKIQGKDYDWSDPANILITRMMAERLFPGETAVGKMIREYDNKYYPQLRNEYKVTGVLDDVKRYGYLRPYCVMFIPERLNEDNYQSVIVGFRTKGNNSPTRFIEMFKNEMSDQLRIGNYYLENLRYTPQMEKDYNYKFGMTNEMRMRSGMMAFLLVNITLCILGTFWYRITVRKKEIGIHRALGSDRAGIRKLFNKEGLLLLAIIMFPAMLIEVQFVILGYTNNLMADMPSYGYYLPDHPILRFLITNAITWLVLAIMIVLAIWYPALSASQVEPVDALHDE